MKKLEQYIPSPDPLPKGEGVRCSSYFVHVAKHKDHTTAVGLC